MLPLTRNPKKILSIICLFIVISWHSQAQQGIFHTYHYTPTIDNIERQNVALLQGANGIMYFANNQGIMVYDGINWELIKTPSSPTSLALDQDGKLYVGCKGNFGYLALDNKGIATYKVLFSNREIGAIHKIVLLNNKIFLLTKKALIIFSAISNSSERIIPASPYDLFVTAFSFRNHFYVSTQRGSILQLKEIQTKQNRGAAKIEARLEALTLDKGIGKVLVSALPFDDNYVLATSTDNQLYLFNGSNLKPFTTEADDYFKDKILSGSVAISPITNKIAVGTFAGGVVILDKQTQKVENTLNFHSGLPDDEILAMIADRQGSFWVCHGYGITRIDAYLPIRNFSNYWGLEGNITNVLKTSKDLYVGTSSGVFYLTQLTSTQEVATTLQKELKKVQKNATTKIITRTIEAQTIATENAEIIEETPSSNSNNTKQEKKKGNLFKSIFEGKKKRKEREEREQQEALRKQREEQERRQREAEERQRQKEANKQKQITTIEEKVVENTETLQDNFSPILEQTLAKIESPANNNISAGKDKPLIYKKIDGIEARCKQMLIYKQYVLVATNIGLFVIDTQTHQAIKLIEQANINFIHQSAIDDNVFYAATNQMIVSVICEKDTWQIVEKFTNIAQESFSITEYENIIWIGSESIVYAIALGKQGKFTDYHKFYLGKEYVGNVIVRVVGQELLFFTLSGVYKIKDAKKGKFVRVINSKVAQYYGEWTKIYIHQPNYTWLRYNRNWHNLNQIDRKDTLKTAFLNLFKNIKDIYTDSAENIWVATDNAVYCIDKQAQLHYEKNFSIFIKNIRNHADIYFPITGLIVEKEQSQLEFRFQLATPFYLNEQDIEYQYRLVGIHTTPWSSWSKQTDIKVSYLNAGYYTLEVQARNSLGQISEVQKIDFRVKPPFWETGWFYAIQITFFMGLLLGSFYLSQSRRGSRLANILTLLTVITFFEFMIIYLEPYTDKFTAGIPVFKLVMNIILAASLTPLEKGLHHLLQNQKLEIRQIRLVKRKQPAEAPLPPKQEQ